MAAFASPSAAASRDASVSRTGPVRAVIESLVSLALAVILFRTFAVEGYMISTGSMAEHLLGYHKRVTCPKCGWRFTCGVQYDDSVAGGASAGDGTVTFDPLHAVCPNCTQASIDLSRVPRNQGDQLLVGKSLFELRPPSRWDVVVFRNPYRPTQAYVKRVVGLPGETVQIVDGDVWIDGRVARKSLAEQRALRLPVYDNSHAPDPEELDWEPRWFAEEKSGWSADGTAFAFAPRGKAAAACDWLTYRHWIRAGGNHTTSVLLPESAGEPTMPDSPFLFVRYSETARALSVTGAMPVEWRDQLLDLNPGKRLTRAIWQLYEESHVAPITDDYGYNRLASGMTHEPVRDLMISADLTVLPGSASGGAFVVEMTDGRETAALRVDLAANEARLEIEGRTEPVRRVALPAGFSGRPVRVEMSLFDRQALVAFDGEPAFPPWELEAARPGPRRDAEGVAPPRRPVRFGACGGAFRLDRIVLYRDVHYTRGKARNGVDDPYPLDGGSYFMLGDNSPVSSDSRNWDDAKVPRRLLLGKPFVVHLPSRPGQLHVGDRTWQVRLPDVSQMRLVR